MKTLLLCAIVATCVSSIAAHARLNEPPSRGVLWRFPEYAWANPGHLADDHEAFCGSQGITNDLVGKCGLCGDNYNDARPRKHEIGGEFERGIVVRDYAAGSTISIEVWEEAGHAGWYEFRLCEYSASGVEDEDCFKRHGLLRFNDGKTRWMVPGGSSKRASIVLPAGVTCERCVLQWTWFGSGSNQYYRNCADISIH